MSAYTRAKVSAPVAQFGSFPDAGHVGTEERPHGAERRDRSGEARVGNDLKQRLLDPGDSNTFRTRRLDRRARDVHGAGRGTRSDQHEVPEFGVQRLAPFRRRGRGVGIDPGDLGMKPLVACEPSQVGCVVGRQQELADLFAPHPPNGLDPCPRPGLAFGLDVEVEGPPGVDGGALGRPALDPVHDEPQLPDTGLEPDLLPPLASEGLPQTLARLDPSAGKIPDRPQRSGDVPPVAHQEDFLPPGEDPHDPVEVAGGLGAVVLGHGGVLPAAGVETPCV